MEFVAYLRVSTTKQGIDGLGIEAQRAAIEKHLRPGDIILHEFVEVESGKITNRPELGKALEECRLRRATLLVAKLDRLARNVAFISALMESGVEFVACDFPQANRLTLHILAAVAEHEREMISNRTKAALAVAKARGVKLGHNNLKPEISAKGREASIEVRRQAADEFALRVYPIIAAFRQNGRSLRGIAADLNVARYATPRQRQWSAVTVRNVISRVATAEP
ncbi:recombinase family protein [Geomonas sp. Red69]|uniref:recombinase family protein n=1 Tax=Geomonas diazotrophica TaxID=2843197 RepID=UPI001C101DB1|nr:recombinase family protein [Geomonas diazotrophica]MBU5637984.1 recombinase family protein [Geomonas diazotrophica]